VMAARRLQLAAVETQVVPEGFARAKSLTVFTVNVVAAAAGSESSKPAPATSTAEPSPASQRRSDWPSEGSAG
jgi:hypothetical protein